MRRPTPHRPACRPVRSVADPSAAQVWAPIGEWVLSDLDELFRGMCQSDECGPFYCVCAAPVGALRHCVAVIMGLHRRRDDGMCSCLYNLPWHRCPHVAALHEIARAILRPDPDPEDPPTDPPTGRCAGDG